MPDSKKSIVSRSKSFQSDINLKAASVVQALSFKRNKESFSEPIKSWFNGKHGSLDNLERAPPHQTDIFTKFNPSQELNDYRSFQLDSPTYSITPHVQPPPGTPAFCLAPGSPQHPQPFELEALAGQRPPLPSIPPAGIKSPNRRTIVSDGHLRSSPSANPDSKFSPEGTKGEPLSSKLSTVLPAPAPAMYWHRVEDRGARPPNPLRAHSATLVGDRIFIFGGCNPQACSNDVYIFDTDTMYWSHPQTAGTPPAPRRAHSATLVEGLGLLIFGGGDSSQYYNDLHVLDTVTLTWSSPPTYGEAPTPRRAHSTCLYKNALYVFGGGDGRYPLNDLFRLDLTTNNGYRWSKLEPTGTPPVSRGYHSATLLDGGQLVIFGGSDGTDYFSDMYLFDLDVRVARDPDQHPNHEAGAHHDPDRHLLVYGRGRNSRSYVEELMAFNLRKLPKLCSSALEKGTWEPRKAFGNAPLPRGYHTTILHDSRLFLWGGYDGSQFFDAMYVLDLSASSYLRLRLCATSPTLPRLTPYHVISCRCRMGSRSKLTDPYTACRQADPRPPLARTAFVSNSFGTKFFHGKLEPGAYRKLTFQLEAFRFKAELMKGFIRAQTLNLVPRLAVKVCLE
ncbi:hypothetical protein L0F63_003636, partial [Massospora cicadina]